MKVAAVVTHEPPWYVARLVGADVAGQGATPEEATENLRDAVAAAGSTAVTAEPPVVTSIDVPDGSAPPEPPVPHAVADVLRDARAAGWEVSETRHRLQLRCPDGAHAVTIPVAAREVAPAVFRIVAAELVARVGSVADDRAAAVRRVDDLFARYGSGGDATALVREQRDAG